MNLHYLAYRLRISSLEHLMRYATTIQTGRPATDRGDENSETLENEGMAEREGFEPSRRLPAHTLSRRAP